MLPDHMQIQKFLRQGKLFSALMRLLCVGKQQTVLSRVIDDNGTKGLFLKIFREGGALQDYEMIMRIRQGDKALFGQLAEKYYSEVFRYCYYQTGNEQTAGDCTQETFYHLMRFLDSYTERNQFKAYLLRIALNVCRDYFRKNARSDCSYEDALESSPSAGDVSGSSCNLSHPSFEDPVETRILIRQALDTLPQAQREVIVLFYYHEYRLREIARITGAPLSTVKTRLRAGTGKLQEYFQQNGLM